MGSLRRAPAWAILGVLVAGLVGGSILRAPISTHTGPVDDLAPANGARAEESVPAGVRQLSQAGRSRSRAPEEIEPPARAAYQEPEPEPREVLQPWGGRPAPQHRMRFESQLAAEGTDSRLTGHLRAELLELTDAGPEDREFADVRVQAVDCVESLCRLREDRRNKPRFRLEVR